MAQNVGTPRFYISWGDYWSALGVPMQNYNKLNPSQTTKSTATVGGDEWAWVDSEYWVDIINNAGDASSISHALNNRNLKDADWCAFLGHDLDANSLLKPFIKQAAINIDNTAQSGHDHNTGSGLDIGVNYPIEHKGFSLLQKDGGLWDNDYTNQYDNQYNYIAYGIILKDYEVDISAATTVNLGCGIFGKTYDMPHSPDLNLKLSYEYDGVKNIQTKSGATLSNAMYTKPADWGDFGAWQLGNNQNYRTGRRSWDLSFSYLADTDVFPVNATQSYAAYSNNGYHTTTNNPTTGTIDINPESEYGGTAGQFQSNILGGQDFFSQVWNKTMGNALPFIFQPDSTNSNPDQFAICKFASDTLQYRQVAANIYNIKLKIEEVW